ncbi:MAG: GGDEF domain-containing protein, partial [bacterium]|nr:GGDEF domain-containing protein [bacterium]
HVERVVRSLLGVIRRPLFLEGLDLFLTASAGVGFFPKDASDSASLLWNAEAALSAAKRADRGGLVFFSSQTRAADFRILELEHALRGALDRKEFRLHYQPQIERDGKLVGLEALLHWRHGKLGEVPARQFIPVAEDTGLIIPIGGWVLHTACQQMASWRNMGAPEAKIAVNVSAVQFARPDLADLVAEALRDSGVNPS